MAQSRESERRALQRMLETPALAKAVPQLPAELLHRVIQRQGLEDAAEIVALATPEQLTRVFDLDLWRPARVGLDEQFDAARFGVWLHVLLEGGAASAARVLAEMSPGLVIAGVSQHARVFDVATELPYTCELGGYRLLARRGDAWDTIVEALVALEEAHPASFQRVMTGCRALSNSRPEESGMHALLDEPGQAMFDLALGRDERRARQGYVTPAQAHAFLELSRRTPLTTPPSGAAHPLANAYFRGMEEHVRDAQPLNGGVEVAALVEWLFDAGILSPRTRALPSAAGPDSGRLARIHAALRHAAERDPEIHERRSAELSYLANTLVSACSIQSRAFTPQEASDAAIATCNLGLEHWPPPRADDVLVAHDLIGVFQIGWAVLYERVSVETPRRLLDALTRLRCRDRDTQIGVSRLRVQLTRQLEAGTPWRARAALDVLASVDLPAWAVLLGLLDECPVFNPCLAVAPGAKVHSVSPTAFEFISEDAQLRAVDTFLASLPAVLQG